MADKSPLGREQIESEDDFSLPSTLTKKQNFFEINYNPSDIVDSDSDQNLDADELSDIHTTNRDEASQYSLFRKPIEQLVNDVNPNSMINMEAQMHLNMLQQQQQQQSYSKLRFADIGRNKTQENQNFHNNLFVNDEEEDYQESNTRKSANDMKNVSNMTGFLSGATQDNSLPLIKLNMNKQVSNNKAIDNKPLMKFRSHEAEIEFKSGGLQSNYNNLHHQHQQLQQQYLVHGGQGFTGPDGTLIPGIDQASDAASSFMISNFTFSSNNNNTTTDQQATFVTKQLQILNQSQVSQNNVNHQSHNTTQNHSSVESAQQIQQNSGQQFQQQPQTQQQQQSSFFNIQNQQQNQNFMRDQYDQAFANPQYYKQDTKNATFDQQKQQQQQQYQDSIFSPNSQFYKQQQPQQQFQKQLTQDSSQSTNTLQFNIMTKRSNTQFDSHNSSQSQQQQQQSAQQQQFSTSSSPFYLNQNQQQQLQQQQQRSPQPFIQVSSPISQGSLNKFQNVSQVQNQSSPMKLGQLQSQQQQQNKSQMQFQLTQQQQMQQQPQQKAVMFAQQSKEISNDNVFKNQSQMSIVSQQPSQYPNQFQFNQQAPQIFNQGPSIQLRKDTHSPTSFLTNNQSSGQQPQNHSQSTSPKITYQQTQTPNQRQNIVNQQQQQPVFQQQVIHQQQQNQQQIDDQQRFLEFPIINLSQQDSHSSNVSSNIGYKTPVFSSTGLIMNQFEDQQQKQLISGFEGIELNNQQQQIQNNNLPTTPKSIQQQQQPLIHIQPKQQQQTNGFDVISDQNSNQVIDQNQRQPLQNQLVVPSQIPTTMPPPGFEKVIPNPQRNMMSVQDHNMSQMQISAQPQLQSANHISTIQPQMQTSTSILTSTTSIPTQYAPQLANPFAGKQLGGAQNHMSIANTSGMIFPSQQPAPISNNVLIDQNESILVKIMCNYEEATSQSQKLQSLKGNVTKLAINQTGSKFLQRLLDNANPQIVQFLLDEIQSHLPMVMVDNYGNYFCQELLINCSSAQRMQILERIAVDFVAICCNKKGTHTIQKFIDLVNLEAEEKFFQRVLAGHVALLSSDVQGTHVIQNIIKCFDESKRQFVFDEIFDQFVDLATDYSGLSVIKIIISKTQKPENRHRLMKKLVTNAIELAQNPYGNYAIQQTFDFWDKEMCQDLIPQFFGKVYQLSLQKCSSNVIDKCIQNAKPEYLSIIMQELINCDRLNNLITNAYGNFVVQNALKFATQEERTKLAEQIEKNIPNITDSKIKQKWVALLKKKSLGDTKGMFKSQESDTSETSSKSKKGGMHMDYSNRSDHGKTNKKPQGGNYGNPNYVPNANQGTMPPPSNRGAYGTGYYNPNIVPSQQQQPMMMHTQNPQMMYGAGGQMYYNPQMQMYVQTQQTNQMMMGKQGQNNNMMVSAGQGYLVHPQGYLIQQPSQMAPAYQQNMYQQYAQPQYQQPVSHQYDPLGLPEQSILGKRPLAQTQIQNAQQLQQFQPNQNHQAPQNMNQYQQQMQQQNAQNQGSNLIQTQQTNNNQQQQQQQFQGQGLGIEFRRYNHSNTQ